MKFLYIKTLEYQFQDHHIKLYVNVQTKHTPLNTDCLKVCPAISHACIDWDTEIGSDIHIPSKFFMSTVSFLFTTCLLAWYGDGECIGIHKNQFNYGTLRGAVCIERSYPRFPVIEWYMYTTCSQSYSIAFKELCLEVDCIAWNIFCCWTDNACNYNSWDYFIWCCMLVVGTKVSL